MGDDEIGGGSEGIRRDLPSRSASSHTIRQEAEVDSIAHCPQASDRELIDTLSLQYFSRSEEKGRRCKDKSDANLSATSCNAGERKLPLRSAASHTIIVNQNRESAEGKVFVGLLRGEQDSRPRLHDTPGQLDRPRQLVPPGKP